MLLDLRLSGNAKSPKVAWDTRAMRDRLAGRASAALTEQRAKLEADLRASAQRALEQKLGMGDSTRQTPSVRDMGNAARDSIKKAAGGLLDGFFKKPKPTAPATTPPSAPATPDTTQR